MILASPMIRRDVELPGQTLEKPLKEDSWRRLSSAWEGPRPRLLGGLFAISRVVFSHMAQRRRCELAGLGIPSLPSPPPQGLEEPIQEHSTNRNCISEQAPAGRWRRFGHGRRAGRPRAGPQVLAKGRKPLPATEMQEAKPSKS